MMRVGSPHLRCQAQTRGWHASNEDQRVAQQAQGTPIYTQLSQSLQERILLIDGGPGQVAQAIEVLRELARRLGRDVKRVHEDATELVAFGLNVITGRRLRHGFHP